MERSQVRMPAGALKQVGEYQPQISLITDVVVMINVQAIGGNFSEKLVDAAGIEPA